MIIDMQRRLTECGRIRIGQQVPSNNGKTRPAKLDTFRLTSADKTRIEQAAALYGGTPAQWDAPAGPQWEVITTSDSMDVVVPPSAMAFSQWYELWSAGGCQRRCDGVTEAINERPCPCDPDNRECAIHSRLSVMLRDLPGLGVWRIDTSGWYAAQELQAAVEVIHIAAGRGAMLPARLRLEQRAVKRTVDGVTQTRRFAVPVLDIEVSPAQLLAAQGGTVRPVGFTPVPALSEGPGQSIAEQSVPPPARPKRSNAAPEIPRSGRQRNGGQQSTDVVTSIRNRVLEAQDDTALKALWESAKKQGVGSAETTDGEGALTTLKQLVTNRLASIRGGKASTNESPPSSFVEDLERINAWFRDRKIGSVDKLSYVAALAQRTDLMSVGELTGDEASIVATLLDGFAKTDDPLTALQEVSAEWYEREGKS